MMGPVGWVVVGCSGSVWGAATPWGVRDLAWGTCGSISDIGCPSEMPRGSADGGGACIDTRCESLYDQAICQHPAPSAPSPDEPARGDTGWRYGCPCGKESLVDGRRPAVITTLAKYLGRGPTFRIVGCIPGKASGEVSERPLPVGK